MAALPHYYSRLGPFKETFLSGTPILTYHHVGPRPRGARLKGLYVSPRLFATQLRELQEAGFTAPDLDLLKVGRGVPTAPPNPAREVGRECPHPATFDHHRRAGDSPALPQGCPLVGRGVPTAPPNPAREVGRECPHPATFDHHRRAGDSPALPQGCPLVGRGVPTAPPNPAVADHPRVFITFDDGFRDVFEHALEPLRQHNFRGIQFLVADFLGKTNAWQQRAGDVTEPLMDEAQVRDWLAAGHSIGSHTLSHPWLTRVPIDVAREEISSSKKKLEDRFGVAVRHFCYPYGDVNAAVTELVEQAGYATACTTKTGVNLPGDSPFWLKRITARYPSRSLKALWARTRDRFWPT